MAENGVMNMENSLKGLILAAGTIITCLVISLGFFIAKEAKISAMSGAGKISSLNSEFMESDKVIYDGTQISGSEVINAIHKFSDEKLSIIVETNKNSSTYNYSFNNQKGELSLTNTYTATDPSAPTYINPAGRFNSEVIRDINGSIIQLKFTQI